MDREDIFKKHLGKISRQSFWFGVLLGVLGGLALGYAIGYGQGDKTIVVPLSQGVKV